MSGGKRSVSEISREVELAQEPADNGKCETSEMSEISVCKSIAARNHFPKTTKQS